MWKIVVFFSVAIGTPFSRQTRSTSPGGLPLVVLSENDSTVGFDAVGSSCTGQRSHLKHSRAALGEHSSLH